MKRKAVTLQLEGEIPQPQSAYDIAVEEGYEGSEEQYGKELATIPPTQEQFDAIPGRISKLTTTTEKSDFHHITDSAASRVADFGMEGKTEQPTMEGRNWVSEKFSDYESGSYSATDGTKTDNANAVRLKELISASDSNIYAYVESPVTGVKIIARGYGENKEFLYNLGVLTSGSTKYIQADTKYISVSLFNDDTIMTLSDWQEAFENGLKLYISSSTKTTYEPYTNGSSPNPDYPQEIVNAGVYNEETGRYEIGCSVENQNLFVVPLLISGTELSQSTGVVIESDMYYASDYIATRKSSYKYIAFCSELTKKRIIFYDKNKKYINGFGTNNTNFFATIPSDAEFFRYSFYCEDIENITEKKTVVERTKGNTIASEYVEGKGQNFTLTSPVPLTKWDYLTKRDGVWGWSINNDTYEVTGSDLYPNQYDNGSCTNRFAAVPSKNIHNPYDGKCEDLMFYKPGIWGEKNIEGFSLNSTNQIHICIRNSIIGVSDDATLDEKTVALRNYLKGRYERVNPLSVMYWTSTEQSFHPLPDEEQILLNNLETYYGVTNLYNDQGCPMWLTYVQDTKTAVDNKFNNIRQAILSLGGNV